MQHELIDYSCKFAQVSQQADVVSIKSLLGAGRKQANKQEDNHYCIDNNLSYMSSTQGNKRRSRKILVRRGFSSAVTY